MDETVRSLWCDAGGVRKVRHREKEHFGEDRVEVFCRLRTGLTVHESLYVRGSGPRRIVRFGGTQVPEGGIFLYATGRLGLGR